MKTTLLSRMMAAALIVVFFVSESLAATAGPTLPDPGNPGISKQQQEQLGLQAMAEVYKQMPVLPDSSPEAQYIQRVGKKLASVIPQQYSWPFQFHVIPAKDINAFALPGGPMFVNVGTVVAAQNEAELAGVMAHEMAHVYMQHSAKQATGKGALIGGLAQIAGGILGSMGGIGGALGQLGVGIGAGVVTMKYSREDEAQADSVGAMILYKAGYDPHYMAQFFEELAKEGGSGPQWLSDHPNPGNRQKAIDQEIASWPSRNFQNNTQAFQQAKNQAQQIKTYTAQQIQQGAQSGEWARINQQNGAIPKNLPVSQSGSQSQGPAPGNADLSNVTLAQVKPSGGMKQLQHSAFTISYPSNWQAFGNPDSAVTIAPEAGISQGAVAYGVILNGGQDPNAQSLDQATMDLVNSLKRENPELQVNGKPQRITVNGVQGRSVYLQGVSPVQQNGRSVAERDWLVVLPRSQGGLLYAIFVAPSNTFGQLQSTYQNMVRSLKLK